MGYGLEISNSNNVVVITNDNTILNKENIDENSGTLLPGDTVEYTFAGAGNPDLIGVTFTEGNAPSSTNNDNGLIITRDLQSDKLIVSNPTVVSKPYEIHFFRFG